MTPASIEWPSIPDGMKGAKQFDDAELDQVIHDLINKESSVWFSKITPAEELPPMDDLPEFVQQDIIEDHRDNLEAVPEEPNEPYRERALEYFTSVRDARKRVRPDSLTPLSDFPTGMTRKTTEKWVFYNVTDEIEHRDDDIDRSAARVTEDGKYLFFTPDDTAALETIIFEQFKDRPFESAKVPSTVNQREEIVLCLYYSDDRYKADLRETYQNEEDSKGHTYPYNPDEPVIQPRGYKAGQ